MTIRAFSFSTFRTLGKSLVSALFFTIALIGAVVFYWFLPDANVAAQETVEKSAVSIDDDKQLQPMLDYALQLGAASEFTAFAGRGTGEHGNSEIKGRKSYTRASSRQLASDLTKSLDSIRQLPCKREEGGRLEASLVVGVYCVDSARITGDLSLDGQGATSSVFIIRVAGPLSIAAGTTTNLTNGAQAGNVFFVADNISVEDGARVNANLFSSGDITIGPDSVVSGKALALGKLEIDGGQLLGGTTGSMRICKQQQTPVAPANDLSNRLFHFVVSGAVDLGTAANPAKVAPGTCSPVFEVTAGPQTVTELNNGTLTSSGTFSGGFELINVQNTTPASTSTLGSVNLATRVANVNVVAGGEAEQLSLTFTNRRAITGFIEICKRASTGPGQYNPAGANPISGGDAGVTGFFQFTIAGVYSVNQQNPNIKTLQIFTIPVGQCTGPVSVTKGDPPPFGSGANMTAAIVSEIPRAGAFFEGTDIYPVERRNQSDVRGSILSVSPTGVESAISAPGGGYVEVLLSGSGSPIDQTLIVFRNRSNPTRLKVCKIAGPGIPLNTLFRYTVTGTGPTTASHPQSAVFGAVTRTVDVRAGDPAQGGTCEFVPGAGANPPLYDQFQTFVNGTPVTVVEEGISPNNTIAQNAGQLRTSQIRVFGSVFAPPTTPSFTPNPNTIPEPGSVSRTIVMASALASIVEVEFTGFRFNPTILKICNVANLASSQGNINQFTIALVSPQIGGANPGQMFPNFSATVSVAAGQVGSQEGNCALVNGSALTGGAFNQGSTITVTAQAGAVSNISCPSCSPGTFTSDLINRRATISGTGGLSPGVNSVVFTTGPVGPTPCGAVRAEQGAEPVLTTCGAGRFDFDGDRKADPAVFTPSTARFSYWSSAQNGVIVSRSFGLGTDKLVTADYDGDGRTDIAVWRPSEGRWYIQGSTGIFEYYNWGEPGDIPQVGDYDGDGKADFALFRPTNSTWYIRTRFNEFRIVPFGVPTDRPVAAEYDGDGRTDIAVFRDGTWYTLESTRGYRVTQFGQAGDVPVQTDYNGDGMVDFAVYRNGTWYQLSATAYTVRALGGATDIPVPADYDGDGKADIAIYRPSEGRWYIRRSAIGETGMPIELGAPGDIPLQAPVGFFGN